MSLEEVTGGPAPAAGLLTPEAIELKLKRELKCRASEQMLESVELVEAAAVVSAVANDPDDKQMLAAALAAQVDLIVSRDDDLERPSSYEGIPVASAVE